MKSKIKRSWAFTLLRLAILLLLTDVLLAVEWGRFFYSPEERSIGYRIASSPTLSHRFDGEVYLPNGKTIRWIDGKTSTAYPPPQTRPGEYWKNPSRMPL